ncbi:helix-turn-helix domain-containing protein [Streptomyces sp. NBC_00162]|uniref:helix-turn-helix domain-containing protein n=1 Tax=Streptomyces sp. NBC_00162 TaxID=2903629 RepID=UPI00214B23C2|nr:helix-turn-helix transcriptional regulator [Streptomyces sp. NBC_00162]UUU42553.1 helix-turn-helix domain-containing protein [Streptomyces sp. NBC_00162]
MGEAERSGETETFARLMRELKERAGLSYGVLARKLHTSTSTLHRYCNGEAVPTEFAAVDRFARVCGASPGEAVELHRAWLLADARRRAAARTSELVPVPVPVPESEPGPGPEPVAVRLPWYRRRAAAVLAAGVTAGAVAVAVLAASLPERGSPPGAGAGPRAGAVGTATPTAPASSPSPVPSPTPTAVPLKAAVRSHVWAFGCDHAYLAEPGPGSVPPPPMEADAPAWASAQRAVHAGTQIVEITLHGTGTGGVVLEDLEVRVAARRTPPAWNVYQMSQGCGGALTPAAFAVNLDAPRPLVRPVAGNDTGSAVPAPAFPLRVSASEPVVLRVEAVTTGCDCDWSLDLRWTAPSGSGTLRIDDHGRPLRTSAATGRPVYGYAMEQGRWAR